MTRPSGGHAQTSRKTVDALTILGWTERIHASAFTVDMGKQKGCAGLKGACNRAWQFRHVVEIASWLLGKLGIDWASNEFDSPHQNATSLLVSCAAAAIDQTLVAHITPTKISMGFGADVCALLYTLSKQCLAHGSFSPQRPDRNSVENECDDCDEAESADEALNFDDSGSESDVEAPLFSPAAALNEVAEQDMERAVAYFSQQDATAWMTEKERVAPRLRLADVLKGASVDGEFGEWRTRRRKMASSCSQLQANVGVSGPVREMGTKMMDYAHAVAKKESSIRQQFETMQSEYEKFRVVEREHAAVVDTRRAARDAAVAELASLESDLKMIAGELESTQESMSSTGKLIKLRKAVAKVKADTRAMEVTIGVLSSALMRRKYDSSNKEEKTVDFTVDDGGSSTSEDEWKSDSY